MNETITLTRAYFREFTEHDKIRKVYDHDEILKISPNNILYFSQQEQTTYTSFCTKIKTITGEELYVREDIDEVEKIINKFYKKIEESNKDKIVITKDDIVKNFILKNMI